MGAHKILVIGATGTTGSRVAAQLAAEGQRVKAASRAATALGDTKPVAFNWYETGTHDAALRGVDRIYVVPPVGDPDPATVMLPFLEAALAAGIQRVVLLSSSAIPSGGPAVGVVHQALPQLFEEWAVLRPSWFMQNFISGHAHAHSIRDEAAIWTATDEGRVGFIDADDIAAVAVRTLISKNPPKTDLVLTGPEALSYDDVATIITDVTGQAVTHRHLSYEQLRERLTELVPAEFADMLANMDRTIAQGAEDRVTDTVQRITGRFAGTFRQLCQAQMG